MKLHVESHVDHVPPAVLELVLSKFKDRTGFFIDSFQLPEASLECGLYGPVMGDEPVTDAEVTHKVRNNRPNTSRMVNRPSRKTDICTVIAGPYKGEPCVLYTVHGGPNAPKEPNDPNITPEERSASEAFWAVHALVE